MNGNLPSKRTLAQQGKSQALAASFGRDAYDGLHAIAKRECAKTGSKASYPDTFIEFNDAAATSGLSRSVLGLDLDDMRRQLAKGIPYGELTDPEMGSVIEYRNIYKAA